MDATYITDEIGFPQGEVLIRGLESAIFSLAKIRLCEAERGINKSYGYRKNHS